MIYHGTYNSGAMTTPLLQLAGLCSSKKKEILEAGYCLLLPSQGFPDVVGQRYWMLVLG